MMTHETTQTLRAMGNEMPPKKSYDAATDLAEALKQLKVQLGHYPMLGYPNGLEGFDVAYPPTLTGNTGAAITWRNPYIITTTGNIVT